jgi:hypothetical protein
VRATYQRILAFGWPHARLTVQRRPLDAGGTSWSLIMGSAPSGSRHLFLCDRARSMPCVPHRKGSDKADDLLITKWCERLPPMSAGIRPLRFS